MIKLFTLSCFLILFGCDLKAQQRSDTKLNEPPKKASKIIVLIKDSSNTLLDRISGELFDQGFAIDAKDDKAKFIITKGRPSKHYGTLSLIKARINDSAIVFSSQIAINSDRDILGIKRMQLDYMDVDYSGAKRSAMREAWNEMDAIARMFGDNIVYSK